MPWFGPGDKPTSLPCHPHDPVWHPKLAQMSEALFEIAPLRPGLFALARPPRQFRLGALHKARFGKAPSRRELGHGTQHLEVCAPALDVSCSKGTEARVHAFMRQRESEVRAGGVRRGDVRKGDDAQPRALVPVSESERFCAEYENAVAILAQPRESYWIAFIQEGEGFIDPAEAERGLFTIRERRGSDSLQIPSVRAAPNRAKVEAVNDAHDTPKESSEKHST